MPGIDGFDSPTLGTQLLSIQYGDRPPPLGVRSWADGSVFKANLVTTFPFSPHIVGLRAIKTLPRAAVLKPEKLGKGWKPGYMRACIKKQALLRHTFR